MHYRNNDNCRVLYPKKDTERKAMNDSASCVPMNVWVQQRGLCDARKHRQNFVKELVPQTLLLLLVPSCRIRQVLLCFRPESNLKGHSLRRISVMDSVAMRPRFLSTS